MCTRFLLERAAAEAGFKKFGLESLAAAVAKAMDRFNIAPGTDLLALRTGEKPRTARVFTPRWGFPALASSSSGSLLPAPSAPLTNARAETLAQKPTFREAFRHRRCLIPATGFYEWEKRGRARLPWLFRRAGAEPFAFAGLWEPHAADGAPATVIVTTPPNELMAPLHHRMPALLTSADACRAWLDSTATESDLAALLAPADAAQMTATPVSPRVNRSDFDSPECILPAIHGLAPRDEDDADNLALGL
jgi:putative SOS response-associated peptidase YedK